MNHVVIFPTWKCQLSCDYCSIRHSRIDRSTPPVDWSDWRRALCTYLRPGDIVDIAGGEPLLYPHIVDLIASLAGHGLRWALTTNAKATEGVFALVNRRVPNCICINISDHAGNPEAPFRVACLREAGYHVNVHRVDHPAAGRHCEDAEIITYQDWKGGAAVDGKKRWCSAGESHWVADPRGDLWRCVVALETGQPTVGNLFSGVVKATEPECDFGCTTCYTEDPNSWMMTMREL